MYQFQTLFTLERVFLPKVAAPFASAYLPIQYYSSPEETSSSKSYSFPGKTSYSKSYHSFHEKTSYARSYKAPAKMFLLFHLHFCEYKSFHFECFLNTYRHLNWTTTPSELSTLLLGAQILE